MSSSKTLKTRCLLIIHYPQDHDAVPFFAFISRLAIHIRIAQTPISAIACLALQSLSGYCSLCFQACLTIRYTVPQFVNPASDLLSSPLRRSSKYCCCGGSAIDPATQRGHGVPRSEMLAGICSRTSITRKTAWCGSGAVRPYSDARVYSWTRAEVAKRWVTERVTDVDCFV